MIIFNPTIEKILHVIIQTKAFMFKTISTHSVIEGLEIVITKDVNLVF